MEPSGVNGSGSSNQINNTEGGGHSDTHVHTVEPGETLSGIAQQHNTDVDTLLSHNPDIINPDMVYPGDRIQLPEPTPQSMESEQITTNIDTRFGTSNSEFRVGTDNVGVVINPGDGVVGIETSNPIFSSPGETPAANSTGPSGSVEMFGSATIARQYQSADNTTTFKLEASFGNGIAVEGNAGRFAGEFSASAGFRGFYEVSVPTENVAVNEILAVNPFDPSTIPQGATVTMHGAAYANTEYAGSFRNIAMQTNITEAAGSAISIQRTGENTVRVAAGPTTAVEAFNGVGLSMENVSLVVGRQDSLGSASVISAEFDISTAAGQEALDGFLSEGSLDAGPGVNDVVQIERLDFQSQTRLNAELGPLSASLAGSANVGSSVKTTYADGSSAITTELTYGSNVPLEISQRFDVQGNEIVDARTYALSISADVAPPGFIDRLFGVSEAGTEKMISELLNISLTGDTTGLDAPVAPGQQLTLTFTEAQMDVLRNHTLTTVDSTGDFGGYQELEIMVRNYDGTERSNLDFAMSIARNLNNDPIGFSHRLFDISSGADGNRFNDNYTPIDASIAVQ